MTDRIKRIAARLFEVPTVGWRGIAWRLHADRFAALDASGSLRYSGRFNLGLDLYSADASFAALYLALNAEAALAEVIRNVDPVALQDLEGRRLSEVSCELSAVLDLRSPQGFGVDADLLLHDYDYSLSHAVAAAAFGQGVEAILVPSATALGDNLVVYPSLLQPGSRLTVVASRTPRLRRRPG